MLKKIHYKINHKIMKYKKRIDKSQLMLHQI